MSHQPDIESLKAQAATGNPAAIYNLGVWYLSPQGNRDAGAAASCFDQAADQDFAPAQSALGYMLLRGQGHDADMPRAAKLFERAAIGGFAEAQYRYGELSGVGIGCESDLASAVHWFEKASQQGHPQALTQLAYCTDHGLGRDIDAPTAASLYRQAAEAGEPRAQCALAWRYLHGITLERDLAKARHWYARAARRGYPGAQTRAQRCAALAESTASSEPGAGGNEARPREREVLCEAPRVYRYRDFLSEEECLHLRAAATPFLQPSKVLQRGTGRVVESQGRRSGSMRFVNPLRDIIVWNIERRIAEHTGLPAVNGEPLTILHYGTGDEYRPHYDYFDPSMPGSSAALECGGQRVATFMTYLNDVPQGGETEFLGGGLRVPAEAGAAVMFYSILPDGNIDRASRHAGLPVESGEKWLATRWIRERRFPDSR